MTVDRLQDLYRRHRYTVTQAVRWHLDRIARDNGIYRAVQTVNDTSALAEAAREDAEAKQENGAGKRGRVSNFQNTSQVPPEFGFWR